MTNTGSQHFSEGEKRFYDNRYIQSVQTTTQSGIDFISTVTHKVVLDGKELEAEADVFIDRRKIYAGYEIKTACGSTLRVEKYANLYTSRDKDMEGKTGKEIQGISLKACKEECQTGYHALLQESAKQWKEEVWDAVPIQIKGTDEKAAMDQFAVRFAQYHLRLMVPSHDNRMNIGAKALTGEGYKGHTFWDTEIFQMDLKNMHGGTQDGIHSGCAAGAWMAVVRGVAGMKMTMEKVIFAPHNIPWWKQVSFHCVWHGQGYRITLDNQKLQVAADKDNERELIFSVYEKEYCLKAGESDVYIFPGIRAVC